jgi:hypothetical protein
MEIQGELIVKGETETIGAKGFKKRIAVVKTDEQYPQTIPVEFTQDKVFLLDNFQIGDIVKIGINLRGTEWKGKYFANIQGWKINKGEAELNADKFMPDRKLDRQTINNLMEYAEEVQADDLPF